MDSWCHRRPVASVTGPTAGTSRRASALVHGSTLGWQVLHLAVSSPSDRMGLGPAKRGHPIQDAARKTRLDNPAPSTADPKPSANERLVAEEGSLDTGLAMVARGLLPLAPAERFHVGDRASARTRAWPPARHLGRPGWQHDHLRVSRARGLIEGDRVVGRVSSDTGDVTTRADCPDICTFLREFSSSVSRTGDRGM